MGAHPGQAVRLDPGRLDALGRQHGPAQGDDQPGPVQRLGLDAIPRPSARIDERTPGTGEPVSFAADRNKAFAAGISLGVNPGDTTLLHSDNLFGEYGASIALAANDILCIESPNPEHKREYCRVDDPLALVANSLTLADAIRYEYTELPVMVRHRDFFPVLYMPEQELGKSIVTWDHRLTFSLDVTLETSPDDLAALGWDPYDLDSSITIGTPPAGHIMAGSGKGYSLQDGIAMGRGQSSTTSAPPRHGLSTIQQSTSLTTPTKRKW